MEQRKQGELQDVDIASMKVLFSVVAASFMTLGVIIYMFGDDQAGGDVRRQQSAGPDDRAGDAQPGYRAEHGAGHHRPDRPPVTLHSSRSAKTPAPRCGGFRMRRYRRAATIERAKIDD